MNLNIWVYSVIVQRQSGRHCQHNLALDYCAILFIFSAIEMKWKFFPPDCSSTRNKWTGQTFRDV